MDQKAPAASNRTKIDFLIKIIDGGRSTWAQYENRAAILIGANAVLIAGVISFGLPLATATSRNQWLWLKTSLTIISLLSAVASILLVSQMIAPKAIKQHERQKLLDLPDQEFNVYLFLKIAEYDKQAYLNAITELTEDQIVEQLAAEAHNLSRLLTMRLYQLRRGFWAFVASIVILALLGIVSLLT